MFVAIESNAKTGVISGNSVAVSGELLQSVKLDQLGLVSVQTQSVYRHAQVERGVRADPVTQSEPWSQEH